MQRNDLSSSKQTGRIVIGVIAALSLVCWATGWNALAVLLGLFALTIGGFSSVGHSLAEQREERRQDQILKARWHVLDAAEDVIRVADNFRMGMPPEMEDAIERLRAALAREARHDR
jgi:hypothetical protein